MACHRQQPTPGPVGFRAPVLRDLGSDVQDALLSLPEALRWAPSCNSAVGGLLVTPRLRVDGRELRLRSGEGSAEHAAVVVVADACSDDTAALARRAGATVIEIDARSVGVARDAGVAELTRRGARWTATTERPGTADLPVVTSARRHHRAPNGFGGLLARLGRQATRPCAAPGTGR